MKKIILTLILFLIPSFCFAVQRQLWTQYSGNPIVSIGSQNWNNTYNGEPFVMNFGGTNWVLFYTGTGTTYTGAIGRETSTDGLHWTRPSPDNPVIGATFSGETFAAHFGMYYDGTTLYCFYVTATGGSSLYRQQSTDFGVTWTNKQTMIAYPSQAPANVLGFDTSSIVLQGGVYHMLVECYNNSSSSFSIYSWSSTDFTNWIVNNGGAVLASLKLDPNGETGGPNLHYINGTWYVWYHATPGNNQDNSPLYTTFASSSDLADDFKVLQSNINPFANQINTSLITQGGSIPPYNVADVRALEVNGSSYLYHNRSGGGSSTSDIAVETFPGKLSDLINQMSTVSTLKNDSLSYSNLN